MTSGAGIGRVDLVVDRRDWVLGMFADKAVVRLAAAGIDATVRTYADLHRRPMTLRHLGRDGLVHWLSPYGLETFGGVLAGRVPQVCSVHHLLPGEHLPRHTPAATLFAMAVGGAATLAALGATRVELVHFGVDSDLLRPVDRIAARRRLGLPADGAILGFFAKASSDTGGRKGLDRLIEVLARLRQDGRDRRPALLLSGEGWDTLVDDLRRQGIVAHVRRAATHGAMVDLYGAVDAYLCLSRVEGGPVPVLEAMACGVPVVSTAVGHVPEVVVEGVTGWIVEGVEEATDRLRAILGAPTDAAAVGSAARELVGHGWRWEDVLAELPTVYERAVADVGPRPAAARRWSASGVIGAQSAWFHVLAARRQRQVGADAHPPQDGTCPVGVQAIEEWAEPR